MPTRSAPPFGILHPDPSNCRPVEVQSFRLRCCRLTPGHQNGPTMRKRFATIFVSLCVLTLVIVSVTPASADGWWLQYSDRSTHLCMEVANHSQDEGALLVEATCAVPDVGVLHQHFQLRLLGNGHL